MNRRVLYLICSERTEDAFRRLNVLTLNGIFRFMNSAPSHKTSKGQCTFTK